MKLCFCICGQPRNIKLIIENISQKYNGINYDLYVCLSKNSLNYEKEYLNDNKIDHIYYNNIIKKIILVSDIHTDEYRNSLNYLYKLHNIIPLLPNYYDFYIILRSDFIFINPIDFTKLVDKGIIYVSEKLNNQYIKPDTNKINSDIIIVNSYEKLDILKNIYEYGITNNNYSDCILLNFLLKNYIKFKKINIEYKLILSLCNIIAISGDSGSGKSTLLSILLPLFDDTNLLKFETDRYHKWERGDNNYDLYTHLNPYANYLEKMSEDVYNLKIGNEIYAVNYNHANGKFTNEEVIESKTNIILCGLHTLSNKINFYTDIKIFLDTDRNLIKKWKIKRDHYERKYPINKILQQIERREEDYRLYIETQKINADINIKYYEKEDKLSCDIEILNEMIINKILKYLVNLKYSITYNKNLKIELFGNIEHINLEILKNNYNYDKKIDNDLNGELQFLFILILYNCMY